MQVALRLTETVRPDRRSEVTNPQLPTGKAVEVIVLSQPEAESSRRSVMDILAETPGHLVFQTAYEVDAYLMEERGVWKR